MAPYPPSNTSPLYPPHSTGMRFTVKYPQFRHVVLLLSATTISTFLYVISGRYTVQRISDVSEQGPFQAGIGDMDVDTPVR